MRYPRDVFQTRVFESDHRKGSRACIIIEYVTRMEILCIVIDVRSVVYAHALREDRVFIEMMTVLGP